MAKVVALTDGSAWLVWCHACGCCHKYDKRWAFDGNLKAPTFSPSMLIAREQPLFRCHSFVTAGVIEYMDDSTHAMAGMKVALMDVPGTTATQRPEV